MKLKSILLAAATLCAALTTQANLTEANVHNVVLTSYDDYVVCEISGYDMNLSPGVGYVDVQRKIGGIWSHQATAVWQEGFGGFFHAHTTGSLSIDMGDRAASAGEWRFLVYDGDGSLHDNMSLNWVPPAENVNKTSDMMP